MRVSVLCRAQLCRLDNDDRIVDPAVLRLLDGVTLDGLSWADYLDDPLADAGIIGGYALGRFVPENALKVEVRYWAPSKLDLQQVASLLTFTAAQISDGAAEGGLATLDKLLVQVSSENLVLVQTEDGRAVEPASRVAICARDNDIRGLRQALEEGWPVDGWLRGDTAIHLAILYGHAQAALELLAAGASPTTPSQLGDLPLTLCALSNSLDDDQAATIARALMARGANPALRDKKGGSASDYAANRRKSQLQRVLQDEPSA